MASEELAEKQTHTVTRSLWWPRLERALQWIDAKIARDAGEGRKVLASEIKGHFQLAGVTIKGRADRIDRGAEGQLIVVDYKTGTPPTGKQVQDGFALQLGTLGLMAAANGFEGIVGTPNGFEYWSFAKSEESETGFGCYSEPVLEPPKRTGIPRDKFLSETERFLREAIDKWIKGSDPFTARLNPDLPGYNDYDQLMRLDEWQARGEPGA